MKILIKKLLICIFCFVFINIKVCASEHKIIHNIYMVKGGDSFAKIAKKFRTNAFYLRKINKLSDSETLSVGQQILVPQFLNYSSTVMKDYFVYQIKKDETISTIGKKFNVSLQELMRLNKARNGSSLYYGQKIIIPRMKEIHNKSITHIYKVKKGDSLFKIASNYHVSLNDLKKYNNLKNNFIYVGQKLKIPSANQIRYLQKKENNNFQNVYLATTKSYEPSKIRYLEHTVKHGESLITIAYRYNANHLEIRRLNNMHPNQFLQVGQILKIPAK